MALSIFLLILASLLPVLFSTAFYLIEKKTKFGKLKTIVKEIIIGIVFGGIAIISSEFLTVDIGGGSGINVRDASPLVAGFIFGPIAGIIAGTLGGAERALSVLWGGGTFTAVACSLGTFLSGLTGALCRKFMFNDKKPSWFYALLIGVTTEIIHMLLIFLTNMNDISTAFGFVEKAALPMVLAVGFSVMLSVLTVTLIGKEKIFSLHSKKNIAQTFQAMLLICVVLAFCVTSGFTYFLQGRLAMSNTTEILTGTIDDVSDDIQDASDENLLSITRDVADIFNIMEEEIQGAIDYCVTVYDVSEINYVDTSGIIRYSTNSEYIGYDMSSGTQSSEFLVLLGDTEEYVQKYQPISYDSSVSNKYAGKKLNDGGFVQVGYSSEKFHDDIASRISYAATNRHIGQTGFVIIFNESLQVVSAPDEYLDLTFDQSEVDSSISAYSLFLLKVGEEECYVMYTMNEGYYIVGFYPESEALFSMKISIYISIFMEIIVFAALFIHVYFLIKIHIVNNIQKVNDSLAEITDGNLDVRVNVRVNQEFASLSDDINTTVAALKQYIEEAAARLDKELEFAKQIQHAALPNVFPPYPDHPEFDIYATMQTAKEVGGDFYDFFFVGKNSFAFLVADVSGKGIPAAMFMMRAKTDIKNLTETGMPIDEVFTRTNAKLCHTNDAGMFVTAWIGSLDFSTGILTYVNAGHNPPLIKRRNGQFEYLKTKPNFILAGMDGIKYRKNEIQLYPGDELYLYTDGVTEANDIDTNLYGEQRLLKTLNEAQDDSPEGLCNAVKKDLENFVGQAAQFDDITMLSLKMNDFADDDSITVYPDSSSVEKIADFLEQKMEEMGLTMKTVNRAQVCVDEIYSNIFRYSKATMAKITTNLSENAFTIIFKDNGVPFDPTAKEDPDTTLSAEEREIGGLGIHMVKKMTDSLVYENKDGYNILTLAFKI